MFNREEVTKITDAADMIALFLSNASVNEMKRKKSLSEIDKKIQDILHEIEFSDLSRKEKYTLINTLSEIRKERRKLKNDIEILEPAVRAVSGHSQIVSSLNSLSSKLKNTISSQESRVYTPRSEEMANLKVGNSTPNNKKCRK